MRSNKVAILTGLSATLDANNTALQVAIGNAQYALDNGASETAWTAIQTALVDASTASDVVLDYLEEVTPSLNNDSVDWGIPPGSGGGG